MRELEAGDVLLNSTGFAAMRFISWRECPFVFYNVVFQQALNPVFILIMIPIFENIVYPLLRKCNLLVR